MKSLITIIAKALVDYPEKVKVNELRGSLSTVIELHVAKEDVGKIIGKGGQNVHAIRTILGAASVKNRVRYQLQIIE